MKKSRKPEQFIRNPGYPGGREALTAFIKANIRYPESAIPHQTAGTVVVDFDYDESGKIVKAAVRKGIGHGCDEEALRVVKLLRFNSSKHRGIRVTFHSYVNIPFAPPPQPNKAEAPEKAPTTSMTYTYLPAAKPAPEAAAAKPNTYTYTLKKDS